MRGRSAPGEAMRKELIQKSLIDHNAKCIELSKKYDKSLLVIDVTKEKDAASKISRFLELANINTKFPHANRTT